MITDTISTIQQFVKNGGRYEKDREPAYGEPFYGKYDGAAHQKRL